VKADRSIYYYRNNLYWAFADIGEHQPDAPKATFASTAAANKPVVPSTLSDLQNLPFVQMAGKDCNGVAC
jgi:hypothetical protein